MRGDDSTRPTLRAVAEPSAPTDTAVIVPVKAFDVAKARLATVLDGASRAELARTMATRVLMAAAPLHVAVVCDDDTVSAWATDAGAEVVWTPGLGLDGAVSAGLAAMADRGFTRVVVAHSDLPFATALASLVSLLDSLDAQVLLVPDRHLDGTNVAVVPTDAGFRFAYGPASFASHKAEAHRLGLRVLVHESEALGWDVDTPADLDPPAHLGVVPGPGSSLGRTPRRHLTRTAEDAESRT